MDNDHIELIGKLLDAKLSNLSRNVNQKLNTTNSKMEDLAKVLSEVKKTLASVEVQTIKTNGRVNHLELHSEQNTSDIHKLQEISLACPIKEVLVKLDSIDRATAFRQAMYNNPALRKRLWLLALLILALIALPIWIAYWEIILKAFSVAF